MAREDAGRVWLVRRKATLWTLPDGRGSDAVATNVVLANGDFAAIARAANGRLPVAHCVRHDGSGLGFECSGIAGTPLRFARGVAPKGTGDLTIGALGRTNLNS